MWIGRYKYCGNKKGKDKSISRLMLIVLVAITCVIRRCKVIMRRCNIIDIARLIVGVFSFSLSLLLRDILPLPFFSISLVRIAQFLRGLLRRYRKQLRSDRKSRHVKTAWIPQPELIFQTVRQLLYEILERERQREREKERE